MKIIQIKLKQVWKKLIEEVSAGVRQTMPKLAVNKIRLSSRMNGNYKMSESEIEVEIADSRKSNKL